MTHDDICALCGERGRLLSMAFLVKSAAKAGIEIDKKAKYLHMECGAKLGKMTRDKHHHVPYERPEVQESNAEATHGDTKPMASSPPGREKHHSRTTPNPISPNAPNT